MTDEKLYLWAGAFLANHPQSRLNCFRPCAFWSASKEGAWLEALKEAHLSYPSSQGWTSHQADLVFVPNAVFQETN